MTEHAQTTSGGAAASETPFVEMNWKKAGATFPPIAAEVDGEPCLISSVTARPEGSTYVNLTIGDEKRSLIASNHNWTREQQEINDSAFFGVLAGAPADATLRAETPPRTIAEARAKSRGKTVGKSYFLKCKEGDQASSWRHVSDVTFGPNYFDAISHFDWGEKQRFVFEVISEVVSAQTNEKISLDDMKEDVEHRAKAAQETPERKLSPQMIGLFLAAMIGAGVASYFLLDYLLPPAKPPVSAGAPVADKAPQTNPTAPAGGDTRPTPGATDTPASSTPAASTPTPPSAVEKPKPRKSRKSH